MEMEAQELNKRFFTFHRKKRPYIFLKWAQTQDGFIAQANFKSLAITNDYSNTFTHKMRADEAAILIGTNTALHDNPVLTTRHWAGKNPLRIVLDTQLRLPVTLHLFTDKLPTVVINYLKEEKLGQVHFHKVDAGGNILLSAFITENLWDEAVVISNSKLTIRDGIEAPHLPIDKVVSEISFFSDTIHLFQNR